MQELNLSDLNRVMPLFFDNLSRSITILRSLFDIQIINDIIDFVRIDLSETER